VFNFTGGCLWFDSVGAGEEVKLYQNASDGQFYFFNPEAPGANPFEEVTCTFAHNTTLQVIVEADYTVAPGTAGEPIMEYQLPVGGAFLGSSTQGDLDASTVSGPLQLRDSGGSGPFTEFTCNDGTIGFA